MRRHIATFHKAGSNWTRRLFRDIADTKGWNIEVDRPGDAAINTPVDRGSPHTLRLYVSGSRARFDGAPGEPTILCVRDPRDVVVSQYFSWVLTHLNNDERLLEARSRLEGLTPAQGMKMLVDARQILMCEALLAWQPDIERGGVHIVRYEGLLYNFDRTLRRAVAALGTTTDGINIARLRNRYAFSTLTSRNAGQEDRTSHYRKGIAGDWRNYETPALAAAFEAQYGPVADLIGYGKVGPQEA